MKYIALYRSPLKTKKYRAEFYDAEGFKVAHKDFGALGAEDFTTHHDEERKKRYLSRHRKRENWNDPTTAGALSRWILWNEPDLKKSYQDFLSRFKLETLPEKLNRQKLIKGKGRMDLDRIIGGAYAAAEAPPKKGKGRMGGATKTKMMGRVQAKSAEETKDAPAPAAAPAPEGGILGGSPMGGMMGGAKDRVMDVMGKIMGGAKLDMASIWDKSDAELEGSGMYAKIGKALVKKLKPLMKKGSGRMGGTLGGGAGVIGGGAGVIGGGMASVELVEGMDGGAKKKRVRKTKA